MSRKGRLLQGASVMPVGIGKGVLLSAGGGSGDGGGGGGGSSYSTIVTDDGPLVGYWRLEETSGSTAADESANANDGTINGSPTLGATGLVDNAFTFDGVDDDIDLGTDWHTNLTSGTSVSFEVWFKTTSTDAVNYLLASDVSGARSFYMRYLGGVGNVDFWHMPGSTNVTSSSGEVEGLGDGEWHHVVATYDGATLRLYVDGVECATAAETTSIKSATAGSAFIGSDDGRDYFEGEIDEVAIYDGVLTAAQVWEHWHEGRFPDAATAGNGTAYETEVLSDSPVGYWQLEEASGSVAYDQTSNEMHGLIRGNPTLGVTGNVGNCFTFDAVGDWIDLGRYWHGLISGTAFSVEGWFKTGGTGEQMIVASDDTGARSWLVRLFNGTIYFQSSATAGFLAAYTPTPGANDDTWHHFVCTYDGGAARIYYDGSLVETDAATGSALSAVAGKLWIGCDDEASPFDGEIDDVALYNAVLTSTQVSDHFNAA